MGTAPRAAITLCARLTLDPLLTGGVSMGDKDFIKPLLERRGTVFFGKVCCLTTSAMRVRWRVVLWQGVFCGKVRQPWAGSLAQTTLAAAAVPNTSFCMALAAERRRRRAARQQAEAEGWHRELATRLAPATLRHRPRSFRQLLLHCSRLLQPETSPSSCMQVKMKPGKPLTFAKVPVPEQNRRAAGRGNGAGWKAHGTLQPAHMLVWYGCLRLGHWTLVVRLAISNPCLPAARRCARTCGCVCCFDSC